ncbi:hypothetical protein HaLaN_11145 [Haematococcus lacustris]|uniref:Uncharacterized protein n=1 Tax=Haematococcus lacustris TaxID=44745 RepID=A0A699YXJ2_HAELA|nr:hypothetical protein HaLaN_11145 [Haematococcus lacustris]
MVCGRCGGWMLGRACMGTAYLGMGATVVWGDLRDSGTWGEHGGWSGRGWLVLTAFAVLPAAAVPGVATQPHFVPRAVAATFSAAAQPPAAPSGAGPPAAAAQPPAAPSGAGPPAAAVAAQPSAAPTVVELTAAAPPALLPAAPYVTLWSGGQGSRPGSSRMRHSRRTVSRLPIAVAKRVCDAPEHGAGWGAATRQTAGAGCTLFGPSAAHRTNCRLHPCRDEKVFSLEPWGCSEWRG